MGRRRHNGGVPPSAAGSTPGDPRSPQPAVGGGRAGQRGAASPVGAGAAGGRGARAPGPRRRHRRQRRRHGRRSPGAPAPGRRPGARRIDGVIVDLGVIGAEEYLRHARTLTTSWPLVADQYLTTKALHDPDGWLPRLRDTHLARLAQTEAQVFASLAREAWCRATTRPGQGPPDGRVVRDRRGDAGARRGPARPWPWSTACSPGRTSATAPTRSSGPASPRRTSTNWASG